LKSLNTFTLSAPNNAFGKCFFTLPAGHSAVSIGFHNYANMIFFCDGNDDVIYRIQTDTGSGAITPLQIAVNTGPVKGIVTY
jgi:hypothetical protein